MSNELCSVNNDPRKLFNYAEYYLREGFSVIPLWPTPPEDIQIPKEQWGKVAAVQWKKYQTEKATKLELSKWFFANNYNIGIVTGSISGVVVLDIDSEEGFELAKSKGLPETPTVKTARGYHLYFKHKDGARNFQKRGDLLGIDLRAEGGYVVAPPSIHRTGFQYEWMQDKGLEDLEFAELPDWVLAKNPEEKIKLKDLAHGVAEGERNNALVRLVGAWVRNHCLEDVEQKALEWNQTCDPPDDEENVLKSVQSIWERERGKPPVPVDTSDWDEPALFEANAVPEVRADMLPGFLGDYALSVSRYTQSPEALSVMVGLGVVATCLQKKYVVCPFGDGEYVEPLNLWSVVALNPSERKSPVFNAMIQPLKEWERQQRESLADEIARVVTERDIELKRIERLKLEASKEDSEEGRTNIREQIAEIQRTLPDEILAPRLWIADVTPEHLQQLLVDHKEKMALLSDEGGIFEVLSGMYSNGKVNVDVLLNAYTGSGVRVGRGSRDAFLESPALTFCLTVQPGVLNALGHGIKKKFRDNGMLARFLYCVPKGNVGSRNVRNRNNLSPETKEAYDRGIRCLLMLSPDADEEGNECPYVLHLDQQALEIYEDFAQEVEDMLGPGGDLESLADWGGKLAGNSLRIAGNFHVVKGHDAETRINAETMTEATDLCRTLIPHAQAAFGSMGKDEVASDASKVVEWIVRSGSLSFSKRTCQRAMQSRFTSKSLEPVLAELDGRNIIRRTSHEKGPGRKSELYEVNPVFLEG